ncbi:hypothetical protein [Rickettsia endosymbiont of Gonocerus acuteangulatus]|uniref:hypothetical protein n=1 Tax=Rickettsia endosymbiont of Gonocerus acuteangulatus TaxID=3066266 RepID=UPI003132BBF2
MSEYVSNQYNIKQKQDDKNILGQLKDLEEETNEKYEVNIVGDIRVRFPYPINKLPFFEK